MKGLRTRFASAAEAIVDELLVQRDCEGVTDIAEAFPLHVFPDAIGMKREGQDNLLPYGDMVFSSFVPQNKLLTDSAPRAATTFP
jgi:4-methoxybenzoate monooxygenase (O-demethylating)